MISASARFKANIVTQDEREGDLRGLLNFGHSIGHAYEAILSPAWLHGECVSLGLLHEIELSISLGYCSPNAMDRVKKCLELYKLPVQFDQDTKTKLHLNEVMKVMKVDKKNKGAQKRIVLLSEIGKTLERKASDVPDSAVESILAKYTLTENGYQQTTTKTIDSITDDSEDLKGLWSFRLIPTQAEMRNVIRELSSVLCTKFGLVHSEKDGSGEIECTTKEGADTTHVMYFTNEAGSSQMCTDGYEYVVLPQQTREQFLSHALHFIKTIQGLSSHHVDPYKKSQSTFVTTTVSRYDSVVPTILNQWLEHADAIEFRVDFLDPATNKPKDWIQNTGTQLAYLRQLTDLPIIYTLRTVPQAGKFDPAHKELYYQLLQWGLRWGCDYVDVELTTIGNDQFSNIVMDACNRERHYPVTKIIASFHDPEHHYSWSSSVISQMYNKTKQLFEMYGHSGVIKLVGYANTIWDNFELEQFRHRIDPEDSKEVILINMGPRGKLSRVSNKFMSPATHPTLPSVAASGQLSVAELASIRSALAME